MSFKFPIQYMGDYINGQFIKPEERPDGEFKDLSPADLNDQVMVVPFRYDHVDMACESAAKAYSSWALLPQEERERYLWRLKEVFVNHTDAMAEVIARDSGKPLWEALTEAKALASKIDITLNYSMKLVAEEHIENALPGVEGVIR